MKKIILIAAIVIGLGFSVANLRNTDKKASTFIQTAGKTVKDRFPVPEGYERSTEATGSFGDYLRSLPLKPAGSLVTYFDGKKKPNNNVYDAVVDLPIGKKDLHQCADAVMRLRADYLYYKKDYNTIHFNFTNGFRVDYSRWRKGQRISVSGNKTKWVTTAKASDSYETYWKYMETIFSYAGTASLAKELNAVKVSDMKVGDVFIKGGFPGHAVIVIDMAVNKKTGKKIFMLAQSYMPAQEIQVLKNNADKGISPWYSLDFGKTLNTPEWTFDEGQLERF
jgi:uncharacterized protein DUF4846